MTHFKFICPKTNQKSKKEILKNKIAVCGLKEVSDNRPRVNSNDTTNELIFYTRVFAYRRGKKQTESKNWDVIKYTHIARSVPSTAVLRCSS